MYTTYNFKSKKELKAAVEAWNMHVAGKHTNTGDIPTPVRYFQPGPFGGDEPKHGTIYCEGPHHPQAHRWYAQCLAENGVIVKVVK